MLSIIKIKYLQKRQFYFSTQSLNGHLVPRVHRPLFQSISNYVFSRQIATFYYNCPGCRFARPRDRYDASGSPRHGHNAYRVHYRLSSCLYALILHVANELCLRFF